MARTSCAGVFRTGQHRKFFICMPPLTVVRHVIGRGPAPTTRLPLSAESVKPSVISVRPNRAGGDILRPARDQTPGFGKECRLDARVWEQLVVADMKASGFLDGLHG